MNPEDVVVIESEYDTYCTSKLVCPYCGNEMEIEAESYSQEETDYHCYECDRTFIGNVEFEPQFYSRTYEEYYQDERKEILRHIEWYSKDPGKPELVEYYDTMKLHYTKQLEQLDRDGLEIIEANGILEQE
jgi:transposase-like protein